LHSADFPPFAGAVAFGIVSGDLRAFLPLTVAYFTTPRKVAGRLKSDIFQFPDKSKPSEEFAREEFAVSNRKPAIFALLSLHLSGIPASSRLSFRLRTNALYAFRKRFWSFVKRQIREFEKKRDRAVASEKRPCPVEERPFLTPANRAATCF